MPQRLRMRRALDRAQSRAGLDEVHLRRQSCPRHHAKRVARQRPAPRAEFDVAGAFSRACAQRDVRKPQADEFAEHLADLGAVTKSPSVPSGSRAA